MSTGDLSAESLKYFEEKNIKALLEELMHDLLIELPNDPLDHLLTLLDRKTPLRIILSGLPGCGKKAQSALLAKKYGVRPISVENTLHQEAKNDTEEGKKILSLLEDNREVPEELYLTPLLNAIRTAEQDQVGWVLEGFPQTRSQAIHLQQAAVSPQLFILLDVSPEMSACRCLGRRIDPLTRTAYHIDHRPSPEDVPVIQELKDTQQEVATNIKTYLARKDELIECYQPFFVRISAEASPEEVHREICEQIDALKLP